MGQCNTFSLTPRDLNGQFKTCPLYDALQYLCLSVDPSYLADKEAKQKAVEEQMKLNKALGNDVYDPFS